VEHLRVGPAEVAKLQEAIHRRGAGSAHSLFVGTDRGVGRGAVDGAGGVAALERGSRAAEYLRAFGRSPVRCSRSSSRTSLSAARSPTRSASNSVCSTPSCAMGRCHSTDRSHRRAPAFRKAAVATPGGHGRSVGTRRVLGAVAQTGSPAGRRGLLPSPPDRTPAESQSVMREVRILLDRKPRSSPTG
jgi:hypothetical protein